MKALSETADSQSLPPDRVEALVARAMPLEEYRGRRLLLIIPDATRTAPVGLVFRAIWDQVGAVVQSLDVMVALGTHPAMSEDAICARLDMTLEDRRGRYARVQLLNHEWDNPAALRQIGVLSAAQVHELSEGRFEMEVPVTINRRVFDYDSLLILGPVFPHEVVGFSGGNKYLFPGVAGAEVLDFFHWLGALVSNPKIIGSKWTAVRRVVDLAASMVAVEKRCLAMVVRPDKSLAGLFYGTPESAWDAASDLSSQVHIVLKDRPFHTILSCAPPMYDDLWVGGKCMYKLEPVLADGGELIIYGPHIHAISHTHGKLIEEVGYHCAPYLRAHWDRFKNVPWGILAHSSHVKGIGRYEDGREVPRARVTLATGIPEETCRRINLGYADWRAIDVESYADREAEGVLLVRKAGETLYHLRDRPAWARP